VAVASGQPARILALETSGRTGSVALALGAELLGVEIFRATLNHGVEVLPAIDRLCRRCGWAPDSLEHCYVSAGPGSFTGLRVGVTVARTLGWCCGVRVVRVPTVDVLAMNATELEPPPANLAVVLDAKRRQVYAASFRYQDGRYAKLADACLAEPAEFVKRCPKPLWILGEGIEYHRRSLADDDVQFLPKPLWRAKAEYVHRVGLELAAQQRFIAPQELIPIYIRPPEAEELWAKRHARQDGRAPSSG